MKPGLRESSRRQRLVRFFSAAALLAITGLFVGPAAPADASDAVSKSKTVARYYVQPDGTKKQIDSRTVQLTVDHTAAARAAEHGLSPYGGLAPDRPNRSTLDNSPDDGVVDNNY